MPVALDHRIDSFEIVDVVREHLAENIFPDGAPELPGGFPPVVIINWQLVTAKQGSAVKPL